MHDNTIVRSVEVKCAGTSIAIRDTINMDTDFAKGCQCVLAKTREIAGNGEPVRRSPTSLARKAANGPMFSSTLAYSSAAMYVLRSESGMTVQG